MKKYLAGFLIGVIVTVGMTAFADEINSWIAEKATFDVYVGGEKFESEKPPVVIDGSTYLPLKATGEVLGVDVEWNAEKRRVEIGEMKEKVNQVQGQMASPDGIPIEPPIITPESTPVTTPPPSLISVINEKFGTNLKTYYCKSDTIKTDSRVQYALVTYQGEQYIELKALSAIVKRDGENYYVQVPGQKAVLVQANMKTNENSYFYMGSTFVKLSSVGLQARIEGDTAYIEWAD
ncbi:MAG: stalk domain-containing protein [Spirochaetota bacterium]